MSKYTTHEEAEKNLRAKGYLWGVLKLRIKEHELMTVEEAGAEERPGMFVTRNRILEAVSEYAESKQ